MSKWTKHSVFWANRSFFSFAHKKRAMHSEKFEKVVFFVCFLQFFWKFFKKANNLLIPSEQSERIAQVAQGKWATVRDSLRLTRRNERLWANRSGHSPKMSEGANCSAHLLTFLARKQAIRCEIRWANSQPWFCGTEKAGLQVTLNKSNALHWRTV